MKVAPQRAVLLNFLGEDQYASDALGLVGKVALLPPGEGGRDTDKRLELYFLQQVENIIVSCLA